MLDETYLQNTDGSDSLQKFAHQLRVKSEKGKTSELDENTAASV